MTDQNIFSLKKAYGIAKASPNSSTLALDLLLSPQSAQYQNDLVNELLLAPHFRDFPPSREFRRMFWKCVVEYLEAGGEVCRNLTILTILTAILVANAIFRRRMKGYTMPI
jgi:hypothetical protein